VNLSAAFGDTEWNVTILDGGTPVATAPLLTANASKRFDFRVVVPTYLVQVEIDYIVQMPSAGDKKWSLPVDYLYPVRTGEYFIFLLESDNTTGSAPQAASFGLVHSRPTWQPTMNRWWFFFIARDLPAGARVDLSVYTADTGEISPVLVGLLAIVGAAALIGLALYLRARRRKAGEEVAPAADDVAPPKQAAKPAASAKSTPEAEVARYRKALRRVESDHEAGRLPDDSYGRLKAKYEEKIQTLEADAAQAASTELVELREKKERILQAIRDVRAEREAGTIDPDTAKELEAGYREEAIALMKRLDELE
jgi:FtsZ-binding cell division protein ZapB